MTSRIAVALNLELVTAEAGRTTEHPDALDCILRGRAALNKPATRETRAEAIGLFERALASILGSSRHTARWRQRSRAARWMV
jgi:hypothetical protein